MEYRSMIKSMPFFFIEMKKASTLVLQGLNTRDIKNKAVQENLFQVNTEARKKEIASTVLKRIITLDEFLLQKLVRGNVEMGKLIAVYAIMKTDRLFFEFMNEVFKEKLIVRDFIIEDKDFNLFFHRKKEQSEKVASWDDYTIYKIKQVYIRILFEAGLMKNKKERGITKPHIDKTVLSHLQSIGDGLIANIFLGLN